MRKTIVLCCLLVGVLRPSAWAQVDWNEKLITQIDESCEKIGSFEKSVTTQFNQQAPKTESQIFTFQCDEERAELASGEQLGYSLNQELVYLLNYDAKAPKWVDYFDWDENKMGWTATLKPEFEDDCPILFQQFEVSEMGYVTAVSTQLAIKKTLYDVQVECSVEFNEKGIYVSHKQEIKSTIYLSGELFVTDIRGSAISK